MPSTITLRALSGTPLADAPTRDMVIAAAHAIAERGGVTLSAITATDDAVTLTIPLGRLPALGLAAELRRVTNAWYEAKFRDGPLWGTPPPGWAWDADE